MRKKNTSKSFSLKVIVIMTLIINAGVFVKFIGYNRDFNLSKEFPKHAIKNALPNELTKSNKGHMIKDAENLFTKIDAEDVAAYVFFDDVFGVVRFTSNNTIYGEGYYSHEVGHLVDNSSLLIRKSNQPEWIKIHKKEWKPNQNLYGATSNTESFAESFKLYWENEKNLKKHFPESFNFFEKNYSKYKRDNLLNSINTIGEGSYDIINGENVEIERVIDNKKIILEGSNDLLVYGKVDEYKRQDTLFVVYDDQLYELNKTKSEIKKTGEYRPSYGGFLKEPSEKNSIIPELLRLVLPVYVLYFAFTSIREILEAKQGRKYKICNIAIIVISFAAMLLYLGPY